MEGSEGAPDEGRFGVGLIGEGVVEPDGEEIGVVVEILGFGQGHKEGGMERVVDREVEDEMVSSSGDVEVDFANDVAAVMDIIEMSELEGVAHIFGAEADMVGHIVDDLVDFGEEIGRAGEGEKRSVADVDEGAEAGNGEGRKVEVSGI